MAKIEFLDDVYIGDYKVVTEEVVGTKTDDANTPTIFGQLAALGGKVENIKFSDGDLYIDGGFTFNYYQDENQTQHIITVNKDGLYNQIGENADYYATQRWVEEHTIDQVEHNELWDVVNGFQDQISGLTDQLSTKADQNTVGELNNKVTNFEEVFNNFTGDFDEMRESVREVEGTVNTKADQSDVDALSKTVTQLSNTVNNKADKSNSLAGYGITDAYTKTEINNIVRNLNTEIDDLNTTASEAVNEANIAKTTANEVHAKVEQLDTTIDGINNNIGRLDNTKADNNTVSELSDTVANLDTKVDTKADKKSVTDISAQVTDISNTIDSYEMEITVLGNNLGGLNTRVTAVEGRLNSAGEYPSNFSTYFLQTSQLGFDNEWNGLLTEVNTFYIKLYSENTGCDDAIAHILLPGYFSWDEGEGASEYYVSQKSIKSNYITLITGNNGNSIEIKANSSTTWEPTCDGLITVKIYRLFDYLGPDSVQTTRYLIDWEICEI